MSIKKYGIYLAYPPTIDLRAQGLGRLLVEFLKSAQERKDICFILACPSWMKSSLIELFEDTDVQYENFEILTPPKTPLLLRLYEKLMKCKIHSKRKNFFKNNRQSLGKSISILRTRSQKLEAYLKRRTLKNTFLFRFIGMIFFLIYYLIFDFLLHPLVHSEFMANPKDNVRLLKLFNKIKRREMKFLDKLINSRSDIVAWYCPTAFWPEFNGIKAPRLMCIPDVVMVDFPVSFASVSNSRLLNSFTQLEKSIQGGEYFVTYSEDVKWHTLVQHYNMDPDKISAVPHGVNSLKKNIDFLGDFSKNDTVLATFCNRVMRIILSRSANPLNHYLFSDGSNIKFIFYASQFRPNKNIISLLKAYNYLLKKKYIPHKLILTGNPYAVPEVNEFINRHNLENDVLCLNGLSVQELTVCYKLADLAVNPSLSEGGCPFTLTEALSVDTPVVMARIPVALEVIKDPDLNKEMLFDPYDWKDMADRIEWGIQNKVTLLAKQKLLYNMLEQRTWRTVVDEYINILDQISQKHMEAPYQISKKDKKSGRLRDAA